MTVPPIPPGDVARHLWFVTTPARWPARPFLPVIRCTSGVIELGLMFDARAVCGLTGYFLALPKDVFDTAEELLAHGWRVD